MAPAENKATDSPERQIGRRLAEGRRLHGLSRIALAEGLLRSADALVRIELGRVTLKYGVAIQLWTKLPHLNPLFVATGQQPVRLNLPLWLPSAYEIGCNDGDPFAEVIAGYADPLLSLLGPEKDQWLPESWIAAQTRYLALQQVASETQERLVNRLETWLVILRSNADRRADRGHQGDPRSLGKTGLENHKKGLAKVHKTANSPAMTLHQLLQRLRRATSKRGGRSALADYMTVPSSTVSQWLSSNEKSRREPGGDATLRLLKWVEQQEALQQKAPTE